MLAVLLIPVLSLDCFCVGEPCSVVRLSAAWFDKCDPEDCLLSVMSCYNQHRDTQQLSLWLGATPHGI